MQSMLRCVVDTVDMMRLSRQVEQTLLVSKRAEGGDSTTAIALDLEAKVKQALFGVIVNVAYSKGV